MKRSKHNRRAAFGALLLFPLCWIAPGAASAQAGIPLPSPGEPWIEVHSPHFSLFSNAAPKAVEEIATGLERLRAALEQILPGLTLKSPNPTTLYVFKDPASFAPYQRLYKGRPAGVGGYFLSRPFANYVAIESNPRGDDRALIYHEYLHYVLRNNFSSLPLWLNEGLAEYYSTFEVARGDAKLGLPIEAHVAWLRGHPPMPVRRLLAIDVDAPEYNEGERRGGFYALSWALTHYLVTGSQAPLVTGSQSRPAQRAGQKGGLEQLLLLLQQGFPPEKAVEQALGATPEALDKQLATYLRGYTFPYVRVPIREGSAASGTNVERRPVARADLLFRLGDLLVNLDDSHAVDGAAFLRAALALQPEHGPALASLGQLAERQGKAAEARALYTRAAALLPDDWTVQYLAARSILDSHQSGSLAAARAALLRVVTLRSDFGDAWADLGYTYQSDSKLRKEAIAALETALRLVPERHDVAHNLGIAYAEDDRLDDAQRMVDGPLAKRPELATQVREAILHRRYEEAEALVRQQKLEAAIPLLIGLQKLTQRPDFSSALAREIDELQSVIRHNRFVDRYNQAAALVNRGDSKGAEAMLDALLGDDLDPVDAQKVKDVLQQIRDHRKGRR